MKDFFERMMVGALKYREDTLLRSWCLQDMVERKARIRAVIDLSAELAKICAVNRFSTAFGEMVIEEIIQGRWDEAQRIAQHCRFNEEDERLRQEYAPLWEHFVFLANVACIEATARQASGGAPPS